MIHSDDPVAARAYHEALKRDAEAWARLPLEGYHFGRPVLYEARRCPCGSSLWKRVRPIIVECKRCGRPNRRGPEGTSNQPRDCWACTLATKNGVYLRHARRSDVAKLLQPGEARREEANGREGS